MYNNDCLRPWYREHVFWAIAVGIFILLGGIVPAIFNRERIVNVPLAEDVKKSGKIGIHGNM